MELVRRPPSLLHGRNYDEETLKDSHGFVFPCGVAMGEGVSLSLGLTSLWPPTLDYLKVLVQDFTVVAAFGEPAIWNDLCFQPLDDAVPELITVGLIANNCGKGRQAS